MTALDPYAHGTPMGDHHSWVDPGQMGCPNCICCTVRLCQKATEAGYPCAVYIANRAEDVANVDACPCGPS